MPSRLPAADTRKSRRLCDSDSKRSECVAATAKPPRKDREFHEGGLLQLPDADFD